MKHILLVLLAVLFINSSSVVAQTQFESYTTKEIFATGVYKLSDKSIDSITNDIRSIINRVSLNDSIIINIAITTSTDNVKLRSNLQQKLIDMGYPGTNEGLSFARNDNACAALSNALMNVELPYMCNLNQYINYKTGKTDHNRYVMIGVSIYVVDPCSPCPNCSEFLIEFENAKLYERSKLENSKGDRYYLKRREYKGFTKYIADKHYTESSFKDYVNDSIPDIRYIFDYEDLAKLNENSANRFQKTFVRKGVKALVGYGISAGFFVLGGNKNPQYRHKYDWSSGEKLRVPDAELSVNELAYYKRINRKANIDKRQRNTLYWIGGSVALASTILAIDAWSYHKLSVKIGSPEGILSAEWKF